MIRSLQDIFAELLIHIPISFNYLFPLDLVELFEKKKIFLLSSLSVMPTTLIALKSVTGVLVCRKCYIIFNVPVFFFIGDCMYGIMDMSKTFMG